MLVYLAAQAGLNLAIRNEWVPVRDPVYAEKTELLRTARRVLRPAARPRAAGPRAGPGQLAGPSWASTPRGSRRRFGGRVEAFNFGSPAAGPMTAALYLRRLLDAGARPDYVLVEVHPCFVAPLDPPFEARWLHPYRLRPGEPDVLRSFGWDVPTPPHHGPDGLPHVRVRVPVRAPEPRTPPVLLPCPYGLTVGARTDRHGYVRGVAMKPAEKPRALERTFAQYAPVLADYHVGGPGCAAVRDMLARCGERSIRAAVVLMPESSEFRGWYGPAGYAAVTAFARQLSDEFGVPVFDAREWVADDGFADGHHMVPAGAEAFTDRLASRSGTRSEGHGAGGPNRDRRSPSRPASGSGNGSASSSTSCRAPRPAPPVRGCGRRAATRSARSSGSSRSPSCCNVGFLLALDYGPPRLRDPEYGRRLERSHARTAEHPGRPLVLALGSSRTAMGVRPDVLAERDRRAAGAQLLPGRQRAGHGADGAPPGAGRRGAAGAVVVEYWPAFLHEGGGYHEEARIDVARLRPVDRPLVRDFFRDPDAAERSMREQRLNPWYGHRRSLVNQARAELVAESPAVRDDVGEHRRVGLAARPQAARPPRRSRRAIAATAGYYVPLFAGYEVSPVADRALRQLIAECRGNGIPVALLYLPEAGGVPVVHVAGGGAALGRAPAAGGGRVAAAADRRPRLGAGRGVAGRVPPDARRGGEVHARSYGRRWRRRSRS